MNQRRGDWITAVRGSSVLPLGFVSWLLVVICQAAEPIHIGSRLELFVDDYLIDTMAGARADVASARGAGDRTRSQCGPLGRQLVALSHSFPGRATLPHVLSWHPV